MEMMQLHHSTICVGDRLREVMGDLDDDKASLQESGQIMPVVVRRPLDSEDNEGKPWRLIDGGRRYLMAQELESEGSSIRGLEPGFLLAVDKATGTPLQNLQWEFQANNNRLGFTWQERAKYVRMAHAMNVDEALEQGFEWDVYMTARFLRMSETSTYSYLALTKDTETFEDPSVQEAKTFNTAVKKATIAREKKRRLNEIKTHNEAMESQVQQNSGEDVQTFLHRMATTLCHNADCRDWVKTLKDNSVDFIHWDPPYGNRGFAFSTEEYFQDDWTYASSLMQQMFAESFRVLRDGHWMVVWHAPHSAEWVKRTLQGHKLGVFSSGDTLASCVLCGGVWEDLDDFIPCRGSPHGLWVNPIPYIWHKPDRQADGHEIKRFSLNQYEPYFLAAKWVDIEPILIDSSSSNVKICNIVPKAIRRHPTHKPPEVLFDAIKRISVPGELGVDFGVGSGSIFEACLKNNRRIMGCELDEGHWAKVYEIIKHTLFEQGITSIEGLRSSLTPEVSVGEVS